MRPTRYSQGETRAIDWPELLAFVGATRQVKEPWEIEALYNLAQRYFLGYRKGQNPLGKMPIEE